MFTDLTGWYLENPEAWKKQGKGGKTLRRGSQNSGKDTGQRDWEYPEVKFATLQIPQSLAMLPYNLSCPLHPERRLLSNWTTFI